MNPRPAPVGSFYNWLLYIVLGVFAIAFVPRDKQLIVIAVLLAGGLSFLYLSGGCLERIEWVLRGGQDPGPNYCRTLQNTYDAINRAGM